jgi:hypothetical protein
MLSPLYEDSRGDTGNEMGTVELERRPKLQQATMGTSVARSGVPSERTPGTLFGSRGFARRAIENNLGHLTPSTGAALTHSKYRQGAASCRSWEPECILPWYTLASCFPPPIGTKNGNVHHTWSIND